MRPPPDWAWNVLVVATYLPVALGAAGWIWVGEGLEGLALRVMGDSPVRDLLAGSGAALVVVGVTRLVSPRWSWARRMERALGRVIGPVSVGTCLLLAITSSVGEELLFRGVLQPWIGLVPASILFAAVHVPVDRDLALWPTFALGAGLLLGGLFAWTDALVAPVACHFLINFLNLRHIARLAAQEEDLGEGFFQ